MLCIGGVFSTLGGLIGAMLSQADPHRRTPSTSRSRADAFARCRHSSCRRPRFANRARESPSDPLHRRTMADEKPRIEIDDLLREDRTFPPPPEFRAQAVVARRRIYAERRRDPEAFWARLAAELEWSTPVGHGARLEAAARASGSSAASSTPASTASIGTCAARAATRPRSSGKASPAIAAR